MNIELDGKKYDIVNIKFHDGEKVYFSAEQGFLNVGKGSLDRAEDMHLGHIRKAVKVNLAKRDNFLVKEVPKYSYVMRGDKPRTAYIYAPNYEIVKDGKVTDYDEARLSYQDVVKITLPDSVIVYQKQGHIDNSRFDHQWVSDTPKPLNKIELTTRVTHSVLTEFGNEVSSLTEKLHNFGLDTRVTANYDARKVIETIIKHFDITEKA